jgi:hypothetical protein
MEENLQFGFVWLFKSKPHQGMAAACRTMPRMVGVVE